MTSITDKLTAAKAAPKSNVEVTVSLVSDIAEKREALFAELEAAKTVNDDRAGMKTATSVIQEKIDTILEQEVDTLITLRFTRLPGDTWTRLSRLCPPTPATLDQHLGYGLDETCKLAAKYVDERTGDVYGQVVNGDSLETPVVQIKTKSNPEPTDEWQDIFTATSGPEFRAIVDAIYGINVHYAVERLSELKKLSARLTA